MYGGTKEEMERLLKDAQKISGVKYDLSSYADIVDAIHVVQTEMGITGTTAEEAASTFSGSMASMKAAAKDLLGNLSLGEDIGPSLDALLETTRTFVVDNLLPMVGSILTELPGLAGDLITGAGAIVAELLPELPGLASDILESLREALVSGLESLGFDGAAEFIAGLQNPLEDFSLQDLLDKFEEVCDYLSETFSPVLDAVKGLFDAIGEAVSPVVDSITDFLTSEDTASTVTDALSTAVEDVASWLETAVTDLTDFVTWVTSGSDSAEAFRGVLVGVAAAFASWQIISTVSGLLTSATSVIGAAKAAFAGLNATMRANPIGIVITVITALVATFTYLWNNCESFRNFWINLWTNIKTTISTAWEKIKTAVATAITTVKTKISNVFNGVKATVSSVWTNIKTTISNAINGAKTTVSNVITGIKSKISSVFTSIKTTATTTWNNIKTAITKPINSAKETVKSVIDKIKGLFNFSWSLPKLKLPHVSITGSFSLVPPKVPKFSISWYRSAMDNPMLLTGASIFGAAGDTLLGGGEAGPEVVSGANTLMGMIRSVLNEGPASTGSELDDKIDRIFDLLAEYFPQLANMRVYLDKTAMVGRMAPALNTELGRIQAKEARCI